MMIVDQHFEKELYKMRKTGGLLAQGLFQRRWPVTPMTCNIDDP